MKHGSQLLDSIPTILVCAVEISDRIGIEAESFKAQLVLVFQFYLSSVMFFESPSAVWQSRKKPALTIVQKIWEYSESRPDVKCSYYFAAIDGYHIVSFWGISFGGEAIASFGAC